MSYKEPSDIEVPPSEGKASKERINKAKTKPPVLTATQHKRQVERDLIDIARGSLIFLLPAIVVLPIIGFVLQAIFGLQHNGYIRDAISILGSVTTLILGFLFGASRK